MTAQPPATAQATGPDTHQDRPAPGANGPTSTSYLLSLVRTLIDYGRHLAATLQKRTADTSLADVTRNFGTLDIAKILACISRGLLRAAELEARLAGRPDRHDAAPASRTAPSRREPRVAPPVDPGASAADANIARLPTPADIAAQVRRRPVGAVIADICRDIGIVPSNPLWDEIALAIIGNGGNLATLIKDICQRLMSPIDPPATEHPARPEPYQRSALAPGTGPP